VVGVLDGSFYLLVLVLLEFGEELFKHVYASVHQLEYAACIPERDVPIDIAVQFVVEAALDVFQVGEVHEPDVFGFYLEVVQDFVLGERDFVVSEYVGPLLCNARHLDFHQILNFYLRHDGYVVEVVLPDVQLGLELLQPEQVVVLLLLARVDEVELTGLVLLDLQDVLERFVLDFHVLHYYFVVADFFDDFLGLHVLLLAQNFHHVVGEGVVVEWEEELVVA